MKLEFVRNRLPVCYRHQRFFRWFMIAISFMIVVYSIYFMIRFVSSETSTIFKLLPLIIAFVGLESVLRKITSLNSVTFEKDELILGFIAKRAIHIPYENITGLLLYRKITFYFGIEYLDNKGNPKNFLTHASFPHTMEIILNLADMAPHAKIPEKMQSVVDYLKEGAKKNVRQGS